MRTTKITDEIKIFSVCRSGVALFVTSLLAVSCSPPASTGIESDEVGAGEKGTEGTSLDSDDQLSEPDQDDRDRSAVHEKVRQLEPMGYWPMDEGEGTTLHDRSGGGNAGDAFGLDWKGPLLDFNSGFHWVELPFPPEFSVPAFSVGGWYLTRRDDYIGGADVSREEPQQPHDRRHTQGASLFNTAYGARGAWQVFQGAREEHGFGLRLRADGVHIYFGGALFDVIHGLRGDRLQTAFDGKTKGIHQWNHLLYTFEDGRGVLWLNGQELASADGLPLRHSGLPFLIGNDMSWWMLYPHGSQSLDGSVRDFVFFDRVLDSLEMERLIEATQPETLPLLPGKETVTVDYVHYPIKDLNTVPVDVRVRMLAKMAKRPASSLQPLAQKVLPVLKEATEVWQTRPGATEILLAFETVESESFLLKTLFPELLESLRDEAIPEQERTASALALAAFGRKGEAAVPHLLRELEGISFERPSGVPRIEEGWRNSLLRALLSIARDDPEVRSVLGRELAEPLLRILDLGSDAVFSEVINLRDQGNYFAAMEELRSLDPESHGIRFFTMGDAYRDGRLHLSQNERAYSPVAIDEGITYQVGKGVPWDSADPVAVEDFDRIVAQLPERYRAAARNWDRRDQPLFNVRIHKILPDGTRETAPLEGEWFIFDGHDEKYRGWTIDIDADGYLHVLGGMHNFPNPAYYVPGSWEKMDLSRGEERPTIMYWVSKRPHDITEFEFVGHRDNPRNLPVAGMNYMNFLRDQSNEMFLYGRISSQGIQSWGMYRYDSGVRRWYPVGGDPRNVVAEIKREKEEPLLLRHGGRPWEGPVFTPEQLALVWSWQPHFYNYIRGWGARFDQTDRLHVRKLIRGLAENNRIRDTWVYAYSDDLGFSFRRADGSPVQLPLSVNPAPSFNADFQTSFTEQWWDLWLTLLEEAGLGTTNG